MDLRRRANLVQKIIRVIKEQLGMDRPGWFIADRIVKEVIDPEIEQVKADYVKLFYNNPSDKH